MKDLCLPMSVEGVLLLLGEISVGVLGSKSGWQHGTGM